MTSTAYACLCGPNDPEDEPCHCGQVCIECDRPAVIGDLCAQCDYVWNGLPETVKDIQSLAFQLDFAIRHKPEGETVAVLKQLANTAARAYGQATQTSLEHTRATGTAHASLKPGSIDDGWVRNLARCYLALVEAPRG